MKKLCGTLILVLFLSVGLISPAYAEHDLVDPTFTAPAPVDAE